jgi:hypothetical protein
MYKGAGIKSDLTVFFIARIPIYDRSRGILQREGSSSDQLRSYYDYMSSDFIDDALFDSSTKESVHIVTCDRLQLTLR